jgi:peptide/nickel transport system ATP-binding protein
MSEPILQVRGLTVTFAGSGRPVSVVRGIDFDVHANEVLCIVGESGSGKSVTSLAISGLLPDTAQVQGSIRLGDTEVTTAGPEQLRQMRGREVGMIFQDPTTTLNPVLPIGRQLIEGQVAHGQISRDRAAARAVDLLREVDIPDPAGRATQYPHQFSGGMRQRAVIAMAMAGRPKLIIADEPTTALDVTVQAQVLAVLAKRQVDTGAAVILITHDLGVVAEVADRVAVMYGGRIVESGPVMDIFRQPHHPYTVGLLRSVPRIDTVDARLVPIQGQPPAPARLPGGCSFHPRCAIGRGRAICAAQDPVLRVVGDNHSSACHFAEEVAHLLIDTEPVAHRSQASDHPAKPDAGGEVRLSPRVDSAAGPPLLVVRQLQVYFPVKAGWLHRRVGWVRAVDGVNLAVHAGETVGLVGESGCGKTTTGRAIMGLIPSSAGSVSFDGQDITHLSSDAMRKVRRNMQYIFQDPYASLNPILTVGDIVAEPLRIHGIYEELGGARWVAQLFDMVGLSASVMNRHPREFSGGQRQRIGIARALALKPRLLILDEPVAALDVSIQAQVINLLQDLQRELGLAYVFIAHDLSVVRHISDRVAVMYLGRIVEESAKSTLYDTPVHPYTQSLMSAVPVPDPQARHTRRRIILEGEIPNPAAPPSGCHFHPRCFKATERCTRESPNFEAYPGLPTQVACHHAGPLEHQVPSTRVPEPMAVAS